MSIKKFIYYIVPIFLVLMISEQGSLAIAKVEAPNYSFKLKDLEKFFPNQTIDLKNKNIEFLGNLNGAGLYNTFIIKNNYKLEVFFHLASENKISKVKITLPYYFTHDVFFKSLIKKFGKDYLYQNKDAHAFYRWEKHNEFLIHYESGCAITCFPIYLEISAKN